MHDDARETLAAIDRATRTRLLATLARRFGDLDLAEDTLQDAMIQALKTWPETGVPRSPEAWLTTTAKRKALDTVRREAVLARKLAELQIESERTADSSAAGVVAAGGLGDERLAMFFACAHPVLRPEDRIAMTLRFCAGLTTAEVAHALLLPTATVQQRIVRAKKRIRALGVRFAEPAPTDLPQRLGCVLRVIYLLSSEGFARSTGADHIRDDLTAEAVDLARTVQRLAPGAETTGLLALLLLTESRRPARTDPAGRPVPLAEQDRTRWTRALIDEGTALAESAAAGAGASSYAIQAAIAAVHAEAATAERTDWPQIAVLYRMLAAHEPGPVVSLGAAVARGRADGPAAGLTALDALAGDPVLARYRPFHIARAITRTELGDDAGAARDYRRALELPGNEAEDHFLADALRSSVDRQAVPAPRPES